MDKPLRGGYLETDMIVNERRVLCCHRGFTESDGREDFVGRGCHGRLPLVAEPILLNRSVGPQPLSVRRGQAVELLDYW